LKNSRLKFSIHILTAICVAGFCLLSSGCLDSDFRLEQSIKEAISQAQEGNTAAAINKLESLQDKHPNDANVAEALAIAYATHGNYLLASNYYQKAARLSPEKRNLLKLSAEGQVKAGRLEDAVSRLKAYLESFPEDGGTWLDLGRLQFSLNDKEAAIDSLTRGILLTDRSNQVAKDHQMLGSLYLELRDFAQADYYFNNALALADDQKTEGEVLVGLAKSSIAQEDWDVADIFIKQIAVVQPELLNTSEVKALKETVENVLDLRDRSSAAPVVVTTVAEPTKETETTANGEVAIAEEPSNAEQIIDSSSAVTNEDFNEAEKKVLSEKLTEVETTPTDSIPASQDDAFVPDDLNNDDVASEDVTQSVPTEAEVAPVEIEQAEVKSEFTNPEAETGAIEDTAATPESTPITEDASKIEDPQPELEPYIAPENEAELLLIQAQQAIADGDVPSAIRMSWDSINKRPDNPAGWFILSRAYVKYNQNLNAESAALESMRLNPNNKKIVMNYLGILQRSRGANRFHEELLKAYQRFSSDPDFILALARSFARIKNDPENAAALYRRFLDLSTDEEKVREVRQEMSFVE